MPFKLIILGHRGVGVTNRDPSIKGKHLAPRNDSIFERQILPENSLAAFETALRHGADGIECDVFLSKDGVPMVIHDDQLARNVDGYHFWGKDQDEDQLGNISDYTAAELQAKFSIGDGQKIPTLDEVIQLILRYNPAYQAKHHRNYTINIELKGGAAIAIATHAIVKRYVDDPHCPFKENDFLFNSFEKLCLVEMKKTDSRMRCALGIPTKELYDGEIKMPGWVPVEEEYSPRTPRRLNTESEEMQLSGLDVVSSDVRTDLAIICAGRGLFLNAATNALRLRIEAETKQSEDAKWTELEREKKEVNKLIALSTQFNLLIYYKADNPYMIKRHYRQLEIEDITKTEKEKATTALQQPSKKYDPRLLASLRDRMQEYQSFTKDDLGSELAKTYVSVLDDEMQRREHKLA